MLRGNMDDWDDDEGDWELDNDGRVRRQPPKEENGRTD